MQSYMKRVQNNWEPGKLEWKIENWKYPGNHAEPKPNKLCWKFLNPNKIHVEKIYAKIATIHKPMTGKTVTGNWEIFIDDKPVGCIFDENYEIEITGKG